ncbi:MAG: division/cell wall cluster transcriptional repressor MraZ [Capsulimonadaceae bacterium]
MAGFSGEYDHSLDDKWRVIIPTKIRSLLGDRFYITKSHIGPCLWIYTVEDWQAFSDALDKRPQLDEDTVTLKRFFTATEVSVDTQGRVAIPVKLRSHAQMTEPGAVTIVGTGNRVEIWSTPEWDKYNESITATMISKAARVAGI